MKIKMLGIDLDGTLLTDDKKISPATKAALAKAHEQGIIIVPCSGRSLTGVKPYLEQLGFKDPQLPVVVLNGGLVQRINGEVLDSFEQGQADMDAYLAWQRQSACHLLFVAADHYFTFDQELDWGMRHLSELNRMPIKQLPVSAAKRGLKFYKANFTGEPAAIQTLLHSFSEEFKQTHNLMQTAPFLIECNHGSASKGEGLAKLAEQCEVSAKQVMIFGNEGNDLSMFQQPDFYKVAMGNAIPKLKQLADFVTRTNENDGIAYALQELVF
ncbi:MAG: Cof-type HAD-IIB family hydrolase [Lactobacillus sp.]|jgi:Cof subfamily protein (haloacid dehalogenase superfamily)|nr:Cof-type HAD-IIB family hydrolase [Lactobacillus sp.]MCH3906552.1 Cof-type HAD-IIB family hydrolase [Lactobacillus sp.]MCH3989813.1 Cof-type HAD-IIB family hydrolase [Lactobacillus sp.]MCH4068021.1 Cof-type HAD-IIB family hydrolase [Lactobacillus sp.]MCI1304023.1 Cof-type HAD-IIB family hydrolase [Lactobacillus sp.]